MDGTAEVIIIGAGVIGCSIAYHLAKSGCSDVVVLEKSYIGSGSTERCAGGIRQQFSTEINVSLSIESVGFFERFEEETGYPADFRQHGYLMLATTEEEMDSFRRSVALQRRLGVEVRLLSPQEVKELVPRLNVEANLGATFCPTDGYADPYSVVQGFASAARRLGVKIHQEIEVIDFILKSDIIKGVLTNRGEFQAPAVVNAAGPYAKIVAGMANSDIPVHPSRRHIFVTAPLDKIPKNTPMVVDFHNGFWFRREGPGLILGMRNPDEPEGFDTSVDWGFLPAIAGAATRCLPLLGNIGIIRGQAGLHDDTPDCHAILGKAPGVERLYLACGFSGHGFMHSPAVGRLMAEFILNGKSSPPLSPLSLERFEQGTWVKEKSFI